LAVHSRTLTCSKPNAQIQYSADQLWKFKHSTGQIWISHIWAAKSGILKFDNQNLEIEELTGQINLEIHYLAGQI